MSVIYVYRVRYKEEHNPYALCFDFSLVCALMVCFVYCMQTPIAYRRVEVRCLGR